MNKEEWEIVRIVNKRRMRRGDKYKVCWKETWLLERELGNAQELLREFKSKYQAQRGRQTGKTGTCDKGRWSLVTIVDRSLYVLKIVGIKIILVNLRHYCHPLYLFILWNWCAWGGEHFTASDVRFWRTYWIILCIIYSALDLCESLLTSSFKAKAIRRGLNATSRKANLTVKFFWQRYCLFWVYW